MVDQADGGGEPFIRSALATLAGCLATIRPTAAGMVIDARDSRHARSSASAQAMTLGDRVGVSSAKLWQALTDAKFIHEYWFGSTVDSTWQKGAPWTLKKPDGQTDTSGEILDIDPPRRVVIRWQNERNPELTAEGPSRCTIELEPKGNAVKLSITHEIEKPNSKLINSVSGGWPLVLSNLKSLLETGTVAITQL